MLGTRIVLSNIQMGEVKNKTKWGGGRQGVCMQRSLPGLESGPISMGRDETKNYTVNT